MFTEQLFIVIRTFEVSKIEINLHYQLLTFSF